MLYLMHCSFTERGETLGHGHFDFVVDASDVASAKERLRARLVDERAHGDLFDDPVEVYLDDVVKIEEVPAEGMIGRYQYFLGERPTTMFRSQPCDASPGFDLVDPPDDGEDEPVGGVIVEPFAVFGPKDG
jgi:hypothetical protein